MTVEVCNDWKFSFPFGKLSCEKDFYQKNVIVSNNVIIIVFQCLLSKKFFLITEVHRGYYSSKQPLYTSLFKPNSKIDLMIQNWGVFKLFLLYCNRSTWKFLPSLRTLFPVYKSSIVRWYIFGSDRYTI